MMFIIAAVDESYGMMFNNRRISRDRVIWEKVSELLGGKKIWVNSFTAEEYADSKSVFQVDDNFADKAGEGEYVFIENIQIGKYHEKIEGAILLYWNRRYPSDFKLDYIPEENEMECVKKIDFAGYSHEKITMEVWKKNEKI